MGKSLSHHYVQAFFTQNNCILLDTYQDAHTQMRYICKCGTESITRWCNFKKGHRCMNCSGHKKLTYELVVMEFTQCGCTLLDTQYKNCYQPMNYICVCGRKSKISWDNFKQGHRCKGCAAERCSGPNSHAWNPNREQVSLNQTCRKRYYSMLRKILKKTGKIKKVRSSKLMGYTADDLRNHIEGHPDWPILKDKKWSIDHIFPINAFLEHGIFDPSIINALDNLRPICPSMNSSKRDKYCKIQFMSWITSKLEDNREAFSPPPPISLLS